MASQAIMLHCISTSRFESFFSTDVKLDAKLAKLRFILRKDSIMTSLISESKGIKYPPAKRKPQNLKFEHGAQIVDNYSWLEKLTSSDVKKFDSAQNALTFKYLKECSYTKEILSTIQSMSNASRMGCPTQNPETGELFFFMNAENESYEKTGLKGKPELLVSPQQIIPSSTATPSCLIRMFSVSPDGKVVAYAYSSRSSKWLYIRFKEVATGKEYPEVLKNVCHSDISWTRDQSRTGIVGILYSCYLDPKNPSGHLIAFHKLDTDQQKDLAFVEFPTFSGITTQAQVSDCGDMIFVTAQEDIENRQYTHFFYGDLGPTIQHQYDMSPLLFHLLDGNNLDIQYITNHNCITYFRTNIRAPNFRIVKTNLLHNDVITRGLWETIIPNDPKMLLDWAVCVNGHFLMVCYISDAVHKLQLHNLEDGQLIHKYSLPMGTITEYSGFRHCSNFFFTLSSFLIPDRVLYIKVPDSKSCCYPFLKYQYKMIRTFDKGLRQRYDLSDYRMKQVFCYNSADASPVPIFLIHTKKMKRDGENPCIMYGQGCFGIQVLPSFSIPKLAFLQCFDGIVAVVGVRGGGEYGEKWYRGGNSLTKQTTYDDFIAASEYLIKKKYTCPAKLIIEGQLFGGNLAGACLTQRPDLYAAVIIHEGILDMLRYHLFPESQQYVQEFGDPEVPQLYENLLKISPFHNILNENTVLSTPAVMVLIGKGLSLSHPSNSYKFIAEMQHSLGSKEAQQRKQNPFLLCSKGYNELTGKVRRERFNKIEERAYIYAFLIQTLGLKFNDEVKRRSFKQHSFLFENVRWKFPFC